MENLYTANGMKADFAFLANFAVNSFFNREVRKGREENVQFDHVYVYSITGGHSHLREFSLQWTTSWRTFPKSMIFASIPVVILFSLCYAATRHEDLRSIFRHALYFGGWLTFAMVLVVGIMEVIQLYLR